MWRDSQCRLYSHLNEALFTFFLLILFFRDAGLLNPMAQHMLPQNAMLAASQMNPNILQNILAMGGGNMPLLPQPNSRMIPPNSQIPLSGYQGNPYLNSSMGINPFALAHMLYANNQNAPLYNLYSSEGVQSGQVHPSMLMPLTTSGQQPQHMVGLPTGQIYNENLLLQGGGADSSMPFQSPFELYGQQLTSAVTGTAAQQSMKSGMNGGTGRQTMASNWQNQSPAFQIPLASTTTSLNGSVMVAQKQNSEASGNDLLSSTMFESIQTDRSGDVAEVGVSAAPSNGLKGFI